VSEEEGDGFFAAEPGCAAACFADQSPQLPVPESAESLVAEHFSDDGERSRCCLWDTGGS